VELGVLINALEVETNTIRQFYYEKYTVKGLYSVSLEYRSEGRSQEVRAGVMYLTTVFRVEAQKRGFNKETVGKIQWLR